MIEQWLEEQAAAQIHGWDFSHISGRYEEASASDYRDEIHRLLKPQMELLDIDTGGGEFLLSLRHPHVLTSATEGYLPNVELCRRTLLPLGIDFREAVSGGALPFDTAQFDMVLNRHGDYDVNEVVRVLKPGGVFITEQVGAENDRELVELLLPQVTELPFPQQYLSIASERASAAGLRVLDGKECFGSIKFFDVAALVWFARIIEWEFPGFSVESCMDRLFEAQRLLEKNGCIQAKTHTFLLIAQKE